MHGQAVVVAWAGTDSGSHLNIAAYTPGSSAYGPTYSGGVGVSYEYSHGRVLMSWPDQSSEQIELQSL